jgi:hypothetical protein
MATYSDNVIKNSFYRPFEVTATITRPADTTAYAQYDAISNSTSAPTKLTFSSVAGSNGEDVVITEVIITSTNNTALPNFRLWLFDQSVSATNDNSKLDVADADTEKCVAVVPVDNSYLTNSSSRAESANLAKQVSCASTSKDLYGLLQTDESYTPISEEVFKIRLRGYRMA